MVAMTLIRFLWAELDRVVFLSLWHATQCGGDRRRYNPSSEFITLYRQFKSYSLSLWSLCSTDVALLSLLHRNEVSFFKRAFARRGSTS